MSTPTPTAELNAKPHVVETFKMPYCDLELSHDDHLEKYVIDKLSTGDYVVTVGIGNRVTGGERYERLTREDMAGKSFEEVFEMLLKYSTTPEKQLADEGLKRFLGF